jgi:hypothetical protein
VRRAVTHLSRTVTDTCFAPRYDRLGEEVGRTELRDDVRRSWRRRDGVLTRRAGGARSASLRRRDRVVRSTTTAGSPRWPRSSRPRTWPATTRARSRISAATRPAGTPRGGRSPRRSTRTARSSTSAARRAACSNRSCAGPRTASNPTDWSSRPPSPSSRPTRRLAARPGAVPRRPATAARPQERSRAHARGRSWRE